MAAYPSFAPLSAEAVAADRERRLAAEAEIARREAELAQAVARLERSEQAIKETHAEIAALKALPDPQA